MSKDYVLTGVTELGIVPAGAVLTVTRRERTYRVPIQQVELPVGDSMAGAKADAISEGCWGRIILAQDALYISPGDLLAVD